MIGTDVYKCWRASLRGESVTNDMLIPTGLGGVDGHPQPGMWRKKEGGGYVDGIKQDHRWLPVRIWLETTDGQIVHKWDDDLIVRAIVGVDTIAEPIDVWSWCKTRDKTGAVLAYNAVSQHDYKFWQEHARWPDDVPDKPAGIGHNAPADETDIFAVLSHEIESERQHVESWLSEPHEGETAANMAGNWLAKLRKLEKKVRDAFDAEKEPYLESGRKIDAKWRSLRIMAEAVKDRMSATYADIARKEKTRKQAIADKEAKARADDLLKKQESEREAMAQIAASQKIEMPAPEPPPIVVAEKVKVAFGGASGSKIGLKEYRVAIVTDWNVATMHYMQSPKVREIIQKLANADAKNGVSVPGVKIVVEDRV